MREIYLEVGGDFSFGFANLMLQKVEEFDLGKPLRFSIRRFAKKDRDDEWFLQCERGRIVSKIAGKFPESQAPQNYIVEKGVTS